MKVDIGSKFTKLPELSNEEKLLQKALLAEPDYTFFALKDLTLLLTSIIVIFSLAGYLYVKFQNHPAKKLIPDCGICNIYKK